MVALLAAVSDLEHVKQLRHALREAQDTLGVRKVVEEVVQREQKILLAKVGDEFLNVGP